MDKKTAVKVGLVVVMVMMVLFAGIAFAQDDDEEGGGVHVALPGRDAVYVPDWCRTGWGLVQREPIAERTLA